MLAIGHFTPICVSLYVEGLLVQNLFFLIIGALLFSMIYMAEYVRAKHVEHARPTNTRHASLRSSDS